MGEVLQWIVRRAVRQVRRDHMRSDARDDERVAVGRRLRHEVRADHAAGAAAVLDDEAFLQLIGELRADQPAERVGAAAGAEGHDDLDGPRGVRLGERSETDEQNRQRSAQTDHAPIL